MVTLEKIYRGMYLFLWGLVLKVVLADNLAKIADPIFASVGPFDGGRVMLATYAFSIQIYCDFAGYSFMAIALGLCMGIDLMENFRRPYFSKNISEFWRRWHISLSSWIRDYLYLPLAGAVFQHTSKGGLTIAVDNKKKNNSLLITWLLMGLWHGASWNFVFTDIIVRVSRFPVVVKNLSVLLSDVGSRRKITHPIQQSNTRERRDGRKSINIRVTER